MGNAPMIGPTLLLATESAIGRESSATALKLTPRSSIEWLCRSQRTTCSSTDVPADVNPPKFGGTPAIRLTSRKSRPRSESGTSKNHRSSTWWTVMPPESVTARGGITSAYGRGARRACWPEDCWPAGGVGGCWPAAGKATDKRLDSTTTGHRILSSFAQSWCADGRLGRPGRLPPLLHVHQEQQSPACHEKPDHRQHGAAARAGERDHQGEHPPPS